MDPRLETHRARSVVATGKHGPGQEAAGCACGPLRQSGGALGASAPRSVPPRSRPVCSSRSPGTRPSLYFPARESSQLWPKGTIGLADSALNAPAASFGGVDSYPDFPRKAAVLLEHLVENDPHPDGNKRTAYACLREFPTRNGHPWLSTTSDDVIVTMVRVASSEIGLDELTDWDISHMGDTAD